MKKILILLALIFGLAFMQQAKTQIYEDIIVIVQDDIINIRNNPKFRIIIDKEDFIY